MVLEAPVDHAVAESQRPDKEKPVLKDSGQRCCKLPDRGARAPARTNDHEVAEYRAVVLEVPEANLRAVNYHKVAVEEHAACKRRPCGTRMAQITMSSV